MEERYLLVLVRGITYNHKQPGRVPATTNKGWSLITILRLALMLKLKAHALLCGGLNSHWS